MRHTVWFSCGAASAVAAMLAVDKYKDDGCSVIYCDTMSTEHPDNLRFFHDVEDWIQRPILTIRSDKYSSIDDVFEKTRYMAGISGARCTTEMKKIPRIEHSSFDDVNIFGYTADEVKRADDFEERNPSLYVEWILIEEGVTKHHCLLMLEAAGIKLPTMYSLGFDHNNCIACVKATSAGYWNRTRKHFPMVFAKRAEQSRRLGVRLVRWQGKRIFLDELPEEAYAPDDDIECGPVCQSPERPE